MQFANRIILCLALSVTVSGCRLLQNHNCCPIYVPNDCLIGSEALRQGPCGPDELFHGLKKTCWREWSMEWSDWPACGDDSALQYVEPQPYVQEAVAQPVPMGEVSVEINDDSPPEATLLPETTDSTTAPNSEDLDLLGAQFERSSWVQPVPAETRSGESVRLQPIETPSRHAPRRVNWRAPRPSKLRR